MMTENEDQNQSSHKIDSLPFTTTLILSFLLLVAIIETMIRLIPVPCLTEWETITLLIAALYGYISGFMIIYAIIKYVFQLVRRKGNPQQHSDPTQHKIYFCSIISLLSLSPPFVILAMPWIIVPPIALLIVLLCIILNATAGWYIWRSYDETMRGITVASGNIGHWVMLIGLIIWATADRLDVGPFFEPLSVVVMMMAALTISTFIVSFWQSKKSF